MTTLAPHRELGLTDAEYEGIVERLGREPNALELAVFSLMWSEHCAYKHSKKLLRKLPTEGAALLMGPGENAGAVDVGDGLAAAFKVESHNHPSAVEPFQGAATGVGGILRDVFAVGARPIAVLDSLRFGELDSARSRYLFEWAVAGIGHYGNSVGVPTVGGEVYFEGPYEQNCLVNAMCVGLAPTDRLTRSAAAGVGNPVVLLGALTGRDGIGGASVLASAELSEEDESKRPSVQIGDPFEEKKLIECCLELLDRGALRSLQDLGAAGLSSSVSEMASKGEVGIDLDVAKVPLREADMEPFEIMISESQERMLCVVEPSQLPELQEVCGRWEVRATPIGEVTDTQRLRVFDGDELVGDMPVTALVDECPLYDLEPEPPAEPLYPPPPRRLAPDASAEEILEALLSFAQRGLEAVRVRAVRLDRAVAHGAPPAGGRRRGAVPRVRRRAGRDRGVDRRQRAPRGLRPVRRHGRGGARVRAQPRLRRRRAARAHQLPQLRQPREAAHRLAARPLGGRHGRRPPGARACRWWAATCRSTTRAAEGPIYPTPVVGMVGAVPDPGGRPGIGLHRARAHAIALVGSLRRARPAGLRARGLPGRAARRASGDRRGRHAARDRGGARCGAMGGLASAHDVSEGGLAVALAESCMAGGIGARVDLSEVGADALFGEGPGGSWCPAPPAESLAELASSGGAGDADRRSLDLEPGSLTETAGTLQIPALPGSADPRGSTPLG